MRPYFLTTLLYFFCGSRCVIAILLMNGLIFLLACSPTYWLACVANVCLSEQVPLDCLAEDPSTAAAAAATDDAVYRCAKCRLQNTDYSNRYTKNNTNASHSVCGADIMKKSLTRIPSRTSATQLMMNCLAKSELPLTIFYMLSCHTACTLFPVNQNTQLISLTVTFWSKCCTRTPTRLRLFLLYR